MSRPQPRGAQEEPDERLLVEAAQQDPGRFANIKRFEWRGPPFATWLFRVAVNAIADHYQRSAKRERLAEANDPGEDSLEVARSRRNLAAAKAQ